MTEFTPPFSERSIEELVEIANSSEKVWQKEAINQAKKELVKRGITQREQDIIIEKWNLEAEEFFKIELERLEKNKTESYKIWEIAILLFFGPILFFKPYMFNSHTLFTLRNENYYLKFKQRIIIFILSFIGWGLYTNYSYEISEKKRLEEIEKIDISDWKKKYGY
jgi:hypothetical protein